MTAAQELRAGAQVLNRSLKETKYYSSSSLTPGVLIFLFCVSVPFHHPACTREKTLSFFSTPNCTLLTCALKAIFFFLVPLSACTCARAQYHQVENEGGRIYIFFFSRGVLYAAKGHFDQKKMAAPQVKKNPPVWG